MGVARTIAVLGALAVGGAAGYYFVKKAKAQNCVDGAAMCDGGVSYICSGGNWVPGGSACDLAYCPEGQFDDPEICFDGTVIYGKVCHNNLWVNSGQQCPTKVCVEGDRRSPVLCDNGQTIYMQVCQGNAWRNTGLACPEEPVCNEGQKGWPVSCWDGSEIYTKKCEHNAWVDSGEVCPVQNCQEGAVRNQQTCWDGSKIYAEKCVGNQWVDSGQDCPAQPDPACQNGQLRNPVTCYDGSQVMSEKCVDYQWVPSGLVCPQPPDPLCSEGKTKCENPILYQCSGNQWAQVANPVRTSVISAWTEVASVSRQSGIIIYGSVMPKDTSDPTLLSGRQVQLWVKAPNGSVIIVAATTYTDGNGMFQFQIGGTNLDQVGTYTYYASQPGDYFINCYNYKGTSTPVYGQSFIVKDTCAEGSTKCEGGLSYICQGGAWLQGGNACTAPVLACKNGEHSCWQNRVPLICEGGVWKEEIVFGATECGAPCTIQDDRQACINQIPTKCYKGKTIIGGDLCSRNNVQCTEGKQFCYYDGSYICSGGSWVKGGSACGLVCVEGMERCINGVQNVCKNNRWIPGGVMPCENPANCGTTPQY